jgi:acetylornithine/succinyldiaminopimelate/putrescine aminotransferase
MQVTWRTAGGWRRQSAGGGASNNAVRRTLKPGQHGATFGGNPLACAVSVKTAYCCGE